ncbi:MAG: ABC transporter ATP-binding protein [Candidatus Competibacteraceae bacterium]|nr:ABC transporter ATP-binding protein [Candidatus Competibacteraceae bacterium]
MLFINASAALFVIAILPPLVIIAIKFKQRIIGEFRRVRAINSRITGKYNETITGVRVVKALSREHDNLRSFSVLTGDMRNHSFRAAWLSAMFLPVVQIVSSFALAAVIWYSGVQFSVGGMSIGGLKAFFSYITFMLWPIQDLARVYAEMQHSIAGAERVFSLLESQPEIVNRPGAVAAPAVNTGIEFRSVSFHYDPEKPVLADFNLSVKRGEVVALVGPTGGGKSTIVNLAGRFYEPCSGEILIDGVDYRSFTLETWQSKLGVVLQTPHLFSGTIRENIRYGRLSAADGEVVEAARAAHADEFIRALPGGYDAEVGEGGTLLSMGQKQLISIARALLAGRKSSSSTRRRAPSTPSPRISSRKA